MLYFYSKFFTHSSSMMFQKSPPCHPVTFPRLSGTVSTMLELPQGAVELPQRITTSIRSITTLEMHGIISTVHITIIERWPNITSITQWRQPSTAVCYYMVLDRDCTMWEHTRNAKRWTGSIHRWTHRIPLIQLCQVSCS